MPMACCSRLNLFSNVLAEQLEFLGEFLPEVVGDGDAIEEEIGATLHAVGTAMQELYARRHVFGRCVGVHFQRLGRIGEVGRLDMGLHIEIFAEEGRADMADQRGEVIEALVAVGHGR